MKACQELQWNHDTSTAHRSETNGVAERAVRRVNEGTFFNRTCSKWLTRRMVGLSDVSLLLPAKRAGQIGRWPNSIVKEITKDV